MTAGKNNNDHRPRHAVRRWVPALAAALLLPLPLSLLAQARGPGRAAPAVAASAPVAGTAVAAPGALVGELRDIDFRRGPQGSGRIVVGLPGPQVGADVRVQGRTLVVEFSRVALPERLRRRLDVADFGTPVQQVTTTAAGERVRMVVEPSGAWQHSSYQTDDQFVLELRPQVPGAPGAAPAYSGDKLSLNFQNIELRALLQVIADFTNINIVTSDTVGGNVTLRLKDVPWDQALDIIMQAKGLGMRRNGNVMWIAPKEELLAKEQVELEARKKLNELEPVRTQAFQLNYAKADVVARALNGLSSNAASGVGGAALSPLLGGAMLPATRLLSPRGSVLFEGRTNQLFVTDIAAKLEEVQGLIAKIDIPVRQVLIEARIVEADDKFGRALGVKLGATDMRGTQGGTPGYSVGGGNYAAVGGNYSAVGTATRQTGATSAFSDTQFVNLPANPNALGSTAQAATFALSLFSPSANRFLNLELSALEADGKGKIVSSPRVVTADQVKAEIEQGEEIPYQNATSSGATSVEFKKASLRLEVTPQITPEGNVILDVNVTKDSRGTLTTAGPAINTKRVRTQVLVENGGTVVLGGIFTQEERDDVSKVPLLGDMPVVGGLFRNTARVNNKTELLVFITPKVVSERQAVR